MPTQTMPELEARLDVISNASYQTEKMLEALSEAAFNTTKHEGIEFLVQGMIPRLAEINSIIMSAAGDDTEKVASLRKRLAGN